MKLQAKYSRAMISTAIFVLILGSISYYFILRYVLIKEVDDSLRVEEQEILDHVSAHHSLPEETNYRDQQIHFLSATTVEKRRFVSTNVLSQKENESFVSRQLIFPVYVGEKLYTAIVTKSEEEAEDMLIMIALLTAAVVLLLFILWFITTSHFFRKVDTVSCFD